MNKVVISGILKQDPVMMKMPMQKTQAELQLAVLGSRNTVHVNLNDGMAERARDYFKMGDLVRLYGRLIQPVSQGQAIWDIDWLLLQKTDYLDEKNESF